MITCTINPAAGLTANKVPYAVAGGRLADSGITYDPTANGSITVTPNGTGGLIANGTTYGLIAVATVNGNNVAYRKASSPSLDIWLEYISSAPADSLNWYAGSSVKMALTTTGNLLLGGLTSDNANGKAQVASHSSMIGGYAFGSLADGTETMWRHSAGILRTGGRLRADVALQVNGIDRITTSRPTWGAADHGGGTGPGQYANATGSGASTALVLEQLVFDLKNMGILT